MCVLLVGKTSGVAPSSYNFGFGPEKFLFILPAFCKEFAHCGSGTGSSHSYRVRTGAHTDTHIHVCITYLRMYRHLYLYLMNVSSILII